MGKIEQLPINKGKKLLTTRFGRMMGGNLAYGDICLVVDYYGLMKKSDGFSDLLKEVREEFFGNQVKSIGVVVVHFASIRIDKVEAIAPDMVAGFPKFKKTILDARGFEHKYGK